MSVQRSFEVAARAAMTSMDALSKPSALKRHAGYRQWADAISAIFDRVDAQNPDFYEKGETVLITCDLLTRTRRTGEEMKLPMVQVGTVGNGKIVHFRPFYWNVPAYVAAALRQYQVALSS